MPAEWRIPGARMKMGERAVPIPWAKAAKAGQTVFKTAHYASRLEAVGVGVQTAESYVAGEISALRASLDVGAGFWGRFSVDGVLLEYRAMPLLDGSVSIGTIFPVQ